MARRRFFRPNQGVRRLPRANDRIRVPQVRLVDKDDNMIGVVDTQEALRMAEEAELDLVEVSPEADPPVCRILDFGKYRFDLSKKERASRARSKSAEMKEVRLGRSLKIDPHDIQIRLNQARKFLMDGHKVLIVQNFRGREMAHRHRGTVRLTEIAEKLSDIAKLEMPPKMAGRRQTMVLAPDKSKVQRVRAAAEAAAAQAAADAGADDASPADEA